MPTMNKFFLALAFLGGSAAAHATEGRPDASRADPVRNSKRLSGIMMLSAAKLSDATPAMSGAYALQSASLTQGADNYLPVHHRL
jgi:hypothetical protein